MRANRPSSTARLIARSITLSAHDSGRRRLIAPSEAVLTTQILKCAQGGGSLFDILARRAAGRCLLQQIERLILPGISLHYLARKRWIERTVVTALSTGFTQVIILGAGFDTLAWRLHETFAGVRFFEIDHPATQAIKQRALGHAENVFFVPADLGAVSLRESLAHASAFVSSRKTIFIAEGLLMYFTHKKVRALLEETALLASDSAETVFTFMEDQADGRIGFRGESRAVLWWLRFRREPYRCSFAVESMRDLLREIGLQMKSIAGPDDLRDDILAPSKLAGLPLARGEWICHAMS